jgi:hypothetical protein
MPKEDSKKLSGLSSQYLEAMLNYIGMRRTSEKLNVSKQGIYKELKKRGYRSKRVYSIQ